MSGQLLLRRTLCPLVLEKNIMLVVQREATGGSFVHISTSSQTETNNSLNNLNGDAFLNLLDFSETKEAQ